MKSLTKKEYRKIARKLKIKKQTDREAAQLLNSLIEYKNFNRAYQRLQETIQDRIVLIFGAGPSLLEAIKQVKKYLTKENKKPLILAVDGATQALLENSIDVDIIVTDLDGSLEAITNSYYNNNSLLVVHAHGDNIEKIMKIKELLTKENIIGSTQLEDLNNVKNFGGFSDGDRAAYLAANLRAKKIVLFAFDFGEIVGHFSKPDKYPTNFLATNRKKIKFLFAKRLLQKIPSKFPEIEIFNCTPKGEAILNIPKIRFEDLDKII